MANFIPAGDGTHTGWKSFVQKVGGNLAGMVIPKHWRIHRLGLADCTVYPNRLAPK